jgi:hypothetical protein
MNDRKNDSFAELLRSHDPHTRGRRFEKLVAESLTSSGFDVDLDSPAARPRQTDLLATRGSEIYLWELKWHSKAAHIDHVRGLRDRLRTMAPGAIGVLCSVSGFSKAVLDDVINNRNEGVVLLVDGYESYQFIDCGLDVAELLDRKREQLTRSAEVWFLPGQKNSFPKRTYRLPDTAEQIGESSNLPYVSARTIDLHDMLFTRHPLFFSEYGSAVPVLRLRLDGVETLGELEQLLGILQKELRFTQSPEFSIRQTNSAWLGIGAREFLRCAGDAESRYAQLKTRLHHSEELWLYGEVTDGILAVSLRQRSSNPFRLHSGELTLRIPKLPMDLTAYINIARAVGERRPAFSMEEPLESFHCSLAEPVSLKPLQLITIPEHGIRYTVGLVVRNPFFKKSGIVNRIAQGSGKCFESSSPFARFAEIENLVCSVKNWIPQDDEVTGWHLLGIHGVLIDSLWVLHASCTWKGWEPKSNSSLELDLSAALDSFPDFEMEWKNRDDMEHRLKAWRIARKKEL